MNCTAKIQQILKIKHFVKQSDLTQYKYSTIKESFLQFANQKVCQIVCSFVANDFANQKTVIGTLTLSDVIKMERSKNYRVTDIVPIGIFDQNYSFQQFIEEYANQQKNNHKTGKILRRKLIPKVILKDTKKQMVKKPSQQNTQIKAAKSQKQVNNLKKCPTYPKSLQNQKQIQNQKKVQVVSKPSQKAINNIPAQKQVKLQENKKVLNIISTASGESQDEQELLKKYAINTDPQEKPQCMTTEKMVPEQEHKHSIQEQVEDVDEDEQFERFLKAQKMKAQNKNMNIPDKTENKKIPNTNVNKNIPAVKPKVQTQAKPKSTGTAGQATLFSFMNKK